MICNVRLQLEVLVSFDRGQYRLGWLIQKVYWLSCLACVLLFVSDGRCGSVQSLDLWSHTVIKSQHRGSLVFCMLSPNWLGQVEVHSVWAVGQSHRSCTILGNSFHIQLGNAFAPGKQPQTVNKIACNTNLRTVAAQKSLLMKASACYLKGACLVCVFCIESRDASPLCILQYLQSVNVSRFWYQGRSFLCIWLEC